MPNFRLFSTVVFMTLGVVPLATGATIVDFEGSGLVPAGGAILGGYPGADPPVDDGFGGTNTDSMVTLSGLKLNNQLNVSSFGESWRGFALSSATVTDGGAYFEGVNDTVVPVGGQGGSDTWAVAFGAESFPGEVIPQMSVAPGGTIDSLYVALPSAIRPVFEDGFFNASAFEDGDEFGVRFVGEGGLSEEVILAQGVNGGVTYIPDWTFVDLTGLASSSIDLEFFGTDAGPPFGLNSPAYVAIDTVSITAIPEPSSLAVLGLLAIRRRRRR